MSPRSAYGLALVALAAGGIGLVAGYGLTWAHADIPLIAGADGVSRQVDVTGREVLPLAAAGGWLALAAVAGVVATRGVGRRIVAVIAVLAGLAGVVGGVVFAVRPAQVVADVHDGATDVSATGAWPLAVVAGAVVVGAAVWTFGRGTRWPTLGARYERRATSADISDWQKQDLGLDPTDEA